MSDVLNAEACAYHVEQAIAALVMCAKDAGVETQVTTPYRTIALERLDLVVTELEQLRARVVAAERERDAAVRAVEQREADDQRLYESALERADAAEKALGLADRWLDLNYGYLKPEEDPLLVEFGDAVRAAVSPLPGHEPPGAQGGTASQVPRYQRGTSAVPASDGGAAVRAGGNAADLAERVIETARALDARMTRIDGRADDWGRTNEQADFQDALAAYDAARGALATLEKDEEVDLLPSPQGHGDASSPGYFPASQHTEAAEQETA